MNYYFLIGLVIFALALFLVGWWGAVRERRRYEAKARITEDWLKGTILNSQDLE